MRVKAADIAKELGISRATVSLALNDRPGVSKKTREEVLACKKRMEEDTGTAEKPVKQTGLLIKVLVLRDMLNNGEDIDIRLWTDVREVFDRMAKEKGYSLGITYYDISKDSLDGLADECNLDIVAGVIVCGTELSEENAHILRGIKKPLVVYDCDIGSGQYPCVMADNRDAIEKAVDYLTARHIRDICYVANRGVFYNLSQRRTAFQNELENHLIEWSDSRILTLGEDIEQHYRMFKEYMERHRLPEAFIFESYQISIAVVRALHEAGIRIPEDISLIGIDEIPDYMTGGYKLTAVAIPHAERAFWVMEMLFAEMNHPSCVKSKLYTNCRIVEGNTVKDMPDIA